MDRNFNRSPNPFSISTPLYRKITVREFPESEKISPSIISLAITNNIVSNVVLMVPVLIDRSGLITTLSVLLILGLVSFKTSCLYVKHYRPAFEEDYTESVERIVGRGWAVTYNITSGLMLFIAGIIYFVLICNTVYSLFIFAFDQLGYELAKKSDFVFNKFSYQYVGLLVCLLILPLLYTKKIGHVINFLFSGSNTLIALLAISVYLFIENLYNGKVEYDQINFATGSVTDAFGHLGLCFLLHNTSCFLIRPNKESEKNIRHLTYSYWLSFLFYVSIGVFSYFGIAGRKVEDQVYRTNTVSDYISDKSVVGFLLNIFIFGKLFTNFPVFPYIARHNIFDTLFGKHEIEFLGKTLFNVIFLITSVAYLFKIGDSFFILHFLTAFCGFLIMFVFPICVHWRCFYGEQGLGADELLMKKNRNYCNEHSEKTKFSMNFRLIFYTSLTIFGFCMLIFQLSVISSEYKQ